MDKSNCQNKQFLYQKYIIEKLLCREIAQLCNVSYSFIKNQLYKFQIKREKIIPLYQNKNWLYQKYIAEGLSTLKIAKLISCGKSIIPVWLKKFNIPIRHGGPVGAKKPFILSNDGYKLIYKPDYRGHLYRYKRVGGHITPNPYVPKQVLITEKKIGRYLTKNEVVHHKDGDRINNELSNLQLFFSRKTHGYYEQLLNSFAKQLLFGKIRTSNRKELLQLLETFVKEHGQDIST